MSDPQTTNPGSTSPLAASGSGADNSFADQPAGDSTKPCQKKTWVAIELKDTDGNPVPNEAYRIELPDGKVVEGSLDSMGTAGANGIDPGNCKITFPNLDGKSWKKA